MTSNKDTKAASSAPTPETGLAEGEVVDARLDNRSGDARPPVVRFPGAPQQIDGPDLAHQREFTDAYLAGREEGLTAGSRRGMFSPGPHGLSPVAERAGRDRADESGGNAAPDGETGSPDVGKPVNVAETVK